MDYIDISWPLDEHTVEHKNRKTFYINWRTNFQKYNILESVVSMGTHTGTHIEAPCHFIEGGKTLDQYPLSTYVGHAQVLDVTHVEEEILLKDIESYDIVPGTHVLLKTKNSALSPSDTFEFDFVYLSAQAAEYLATKNLKTVGIDYLAIERNLQEHPAHKALLSKDILITEGLRLAHVDEGTYQISCFPLKFIGTEASPVRAVLWRAEDT